MNLLAKYSPTQLRNFLAESLNACACFEPLSEEYADAAAEVRMIQSELDRRESPRKGKLWNRNSSMRSATSNTKKART